MQKKQTSKAGGDSRRSFFKKTAAVTAAATATGILKTPVYGQNQAPAPGKVLGANERINVAVIGLGVGIGQNHFTGIIGEADKNNVKMIAACDLFSKRRDWGKEKGALTDADVYSDYRKLLERKDLHAIVCATHDVWHQKISCDAMEAGKHVYCEKPMTRYMDEGFKVYDTVKKTGMCFQVGSQGCSAQGWHKAAEMIQAGKIGQLVWSQGYYCRNNPKGEWNYTIDPDSNPNTIDWKTWLGSVKKDTPFSADHFHRWPNIIRIAAVFSAISCRTVCIRSCSRLAIQNFRNASSASARRMCTRTRTRPTRPSAMCRSTSNCSRNFRAVT